MLTRKNPTRWSADSRPYNHGRKPLAKAVSNPNLLYRQSKIITFLKLSFENSTQNMEETGNLPTLEEIKLQNRSNANHYLKSMKPVAMDVGLEFHEKLIHKVDHSLKSTKNRLQRTELLLNLEPPSDEASNHEEWEETIKDLLSSNHRLEFPKFSKIQKQHEIRQLLQRQTKSREKARSREDYNRRAAMILAKETQNLQKKILAGKGQFGGAVKGVEIKTIHNYRGKVFNSVVSICSNGFIDC